MRRMFAAALSFLILVAAGCSGGSGTRSGSAPTKYNDDPKVLNIVMGSEQHLVFNEIVRP
jgi:hypothetical protein